MCKIVFELYKWTPFLIMALHIYQSWQNYCTQVPYALHLVLFLILIIPYIFIHSLVCRHFYVSHQNAEGTRYEL